MDKLITTPHDFIWRVKNPQDYWADTFKEVKYKRSGRKDLFRKYGCAASKKKEYSEFV